jgi:hypothetical protein
MTFTWMCESNLGGFIILYMIWMGWNW